MIVFSIACALLVLVALAFILPPLRHPMQAVSDGTGARASLDVYRRQLAEMESDLRYHIVTNEQFIRDREELEERAFLDLPKKSLMTRGKNLSPISDGLSVVIAIGLPTIAILVYLVLGTPPMPLN